MQRCMVGHNFEMNGLNMQSRSAIGLAQRIHSLAVALTYITFVLFAMPVMIDTVTENATAGWNPEQQISSDNDTEDQWDPDIAVEGDEVFVVWADDKGWPKKPPPIDQNYDIYFTHFDGVSWDIPQVITTDVTNEDQNIPAIAVENGDVHVVWHDMFTNETRKTGVHYRHFNGTEWEPVVVIDTSNVTIGNLEPEIAVQDGQVHVVWANIEVSGPGLFHAVFNGTAWQPIEEVTADIWSDMAHDASIALDGDEVHLTWSDKRDGDYDIIYRHFNGTEWEPEIEISSDSTTEDQGAPSIGFDGGRLHVAWRDKGDGDPDIYYRQYNGTTWLPEVEISADSGLDFQGYPNLAVHGENVHVVWQVGENNICFMVDDCDIHYAHYDGTTWHPEEDISNDVGFENQSHPNIATNGDVVSVVWQDQADGDWDIYYMTRTDDLSPPVSYAEPISPYWQTSPSFDVNWTAMDGYGLANISLYYRYSPDNSSWTPWSEWANDMLSGTFATGSFPFTTPQGEGVYQLYTIATDEIGHVEDPPSDYDAAYGYDITPPSSYVDPIAPYWHSSPVTITATATDTLSGVGNVSLHYRYSSDNSTWNPWVPFGMDTSPPWSWSFDFPNSEGHYEFHSIATDVAGNVEGKSPAPEAEAGYIVAQLNTSVDAISPYWHVTSPVMITATADGGMIGIDTVELFYRHSTDNASWGMWTSFAVDTGSPWSWSFDFPGGEGFYQLYSMGVDNLGNIESPPPGYDAICGYDPTPPSSYVEPIIPYWHSLSPVTVDSTAQDATSGVEDVSLWYRHSTDNASWNAWSRYSTDPTVPYSWSFDFPDGDGHYEFYSIATDIAGNVESKAQAAESIAGLSTSVPGPPGGLNAVLSGIGLQDVLLSWTLSPDDGQGMDNVARYEIHRGTLFDSSGSSYVLHTSVPAGTASFVDFGAGEGDPDNHFYRVSAVSVSGLTSFASEQASKFIRPLMQGPNLVSVPLIQSNESIETVLQTVAYDKAWSYDSSSQEWKWYMKHKGYRRGLYDINHTMGLWVNVTQDCNLTVAGVVPAQTTIHLHEGWNLVSFPSFNSSYTVGDLKAETGALRVEGYDPAPPHHLRVLGDAEMLLPGHGYWVRVSVEMDWIVSVA
ncbi:MAG: hypothetical protein ACE5QF_00810 [Thermoplasmata archaeon]